MQGLLEIDLETPFGQAARKRPAHYRSKNRVTFSHCPLIVPAPLRFGQNLPETTKQVGEQNACRPAIILEPTSGFEPLTYALRVRCSTS